MNSAVNTRCYQIHACMFSSCFIFVKHKAKTSATIMKFLQIQISILIRIKLIENFVCFSNLIRVSPAVCSAKFEQILPLRLDINTFQTNPCSTESFQLSLVCGGSRQRLQHLEHLTHQLPLPFGLLLSVISLKFQDEPMVSKSPSC